MFWTVLIIFTVLTSILFGVGGFLISHWWFKPKNNPKLATIFIEDIQKPYKARETKVSKKGSEFTYAWGKKVIFVPKEYRVRFHNYRRDIFLDREDNLIAIPIGDDKRLTDNAKNDLIKEIVTSNIGAEAIRAIKSKKSMSMTAIIFIVAGILIAGVIGYMVHKPTVITQTVPSANVTQSNNPTLPTMGDVKKEGN